MTGGLENLEIGILTTGEVTASGEYNGKPFTLVMEQAGARAIAETILELMLDHRMSKQKGN